jgi:hypothetical protein
MLQYYIYIEKAKVCVILPITAVATSGVGGVDHMETQKPLWGGAMVWGCDIAVYNCQNSNCNLEVCVFYANYISI